MTLLHSTQLERTARGEDAQRLVVLDAVKDAPHSTERELSDFLGIDIDIISTRLPDLHEQGLVEPSEFRTCRVVRRKRQTWVATGAALERTR